MKLIDIKNAILIWGAMSKEALSQMKEEDLLVLVPENRPYLLGLKHNIPLLKENNINFVYCTDNMLGILFYQERIKKVLLFYKGLKDGRAVGLCGSYYVALLGKLHNIPVEVQRGVDFDSSSLDNDVSTLGGKGFILEENKQDYVLKAKDEGILEEVLR